MTQFKNQETKDVKVGQIETENYTVDIGNLDSRAPMHGAYESKDEFSQSNNIYDTPLKYGALWFKGNKLDDYDGGPIPKEVKEAIVFMGYEL